MSPADQPKLQWPQIVFETSPQDAEWLEEALFGAGALSVLYQDLKDEPVLEPAPGEIRLWDNIRLTGLFPEKSDPVAVVLALTAACAGALPAYRWVPLDDQEWERAWMDSFKPMHFGNELWICPTHCEPVDSTAINIRLDPGLAFGTGTHETTRQCLEWLGDNPVSGLSVIDYGCGSGVLAVAAVLLGARHVYAVDIDEQAIIATKLNAEHNLVEQAIEAGFPDELLTNEGLAEPCDLLIANILFQPLIDLAPRFAALIRPGGTLLVSGLLDHQVDRLSLHYNQWFSFQKSGQQGSWAVLEAQRNQD